MPTSDPRQYLSVLQKSLWFNSLPPVASQRLLSEATVQHLGAGQQLFLRGDSFDGIYCVIEGGLRLTGIAPDGQRRGRRIGGLQRRLGEEVEDIHQDQFLMLLLMRQAKIQQLGEAFTASVEQHRHRIIDVGAIGEDLREGRAG